MPFAQLVHAVTTHFQSDVECETQGIWLDIFAINQVGREGGARL